MAMSRSMGSLSLARSPLMSSSPELMVSKPATMRSRVDLPQPEGPTMTINSPWSICMSMPWMTSSAPNCFLMLLRCTVAIIFRYLLIL